MDHLSGHRQQTIILASSSVYRRQRLAKLLPTFETVSPNIDETPIEGESAECLTARLAREKAKAVVSGQPALIIGSDQSASLDGLTLHKPGSHANAVKQLQNCSGRTIRFYTGLCLFNNVTKNEQWSVETCDVDFRALSNDEIEHYLAWEKPYDCAGSFKVESAGINLFKALRCDDPNILIGLPLIQLANMLRTEGYNPILARAPVSAEYDCHYSEVP
ncbi:MAG: Maf family nucleotide pyrophosphatase [Pseudomonadales bacterium]